MHEMTILDYKEVHELFHGNRVAKKAVFALEELLIKKATTLIKAANDIAQKENMTEIDAEMLRRAEKAIEEQERSQRHPYFHNIWIISHNGTCLLSRAFSGLKFPDTLFAGLLTGIVQMFDEVSGRHLDYIVLDDLVVHLYHHNSGLLIAIICDSHVKERINTLSEFIGNSFYKIYKDELSMQVINLEEFSEFNDILEKAVWKAGMRLPTHGIEKRPLLRHEDVEHAIEAAALKKELQKITDHIRSSTMESEPEEDMNRPEKKKVNIVFSENISAEELARQKKSRKPAEEKPVEEKPEPVAPKKPEPVAPKKPEPVAPKKPRKSKKSRSRK
ncbi:MAG: hypothetical protein ACFFD4_28505 [Candidatus Odinarchaeota archaeon]